jgi:hypothetical protein
MNKSIETSVDKMIKYLSILNDKNLPIFAKPLSTNGNTMYPISFVDLNLTDAVDFNISFGCNKKELVIHEVLDSFLLVKDKNISVFIYNIDNAERYSVNSFSLTNSTLFLNY